MVRDFSKFFLESSGSAERKMTRLDHLGWQPFFAQQTDIDAMAGTPPVRVTEVHRSGLRVLGETADTILPPRADATVGDWLLLDAEDPAQSQLLERKSLIKRRAPGHDRQVQFIAANIDTVFVVSSCNQDFNVARLERYIALAFDGGLDPVILLTKSDLVEDTSAFVEPAQAISDLVPVLALNAKSGSPATLLADWCKPGRTLAFLGTSGVGKSTLTNALLGTSEIATQGLRDDDRGRHTTTSRHLHLAPGGCTVLDTPGMRELQLTDATAGVDEVFADLFELSQNCRFNDCAHGPEPGCAITAAVKAGTVDPARMARWQKLAAEEQFNTATLAERRAKDKAFGKKVRAAMAKKKR